MKLVILKEYRLGNVAKVHASLGSHAALRATFLRRAFVVLVCFLAECSEGASAQLRSTPSQDSPPSNGLLRPELSKVEHIRQGQIQTSIAVIRAEAQRYGGWDQWSRSYELFRKDVSEYASSLRGSVFYGKNGFLFSRNDLIYVRRNLITLGPDGGRKPFPNSLQTIANFSEQLLRRGIHLIFVPIPTRTNVYANALSDRVPPFAFSNPRRSAYILGLLQSGVEVVDVLPAFQQYRGQHPDAQGADLYHQIDCHYATAGILITAKAISERLMRYPSVHEGFEQRPAYSTRDAVMVVPPEKLLTKYLDNFDDLPETRWPVLSVIDEKGRHVKASKTSPILIIGDSYVAMYHKQFGNVGAHITKEIRMPVRQQWILGRGEMARARLADQGKDYIDSLKVVIWLLTTHTINPTFDKNWKPIDLP